MKRLFLATMMLAMVASTAHAIEDYCVQVKPTPDGFLAIRENPTVRSKIINKVFPGGILDVDTVGGYDHPKWTHVMTGGWVATKYVEGADCDADITPPSR